MYRPEKTLHGVSENRYKCAHCKTFGHWMERTIPTRKGAVTYSSCAECGHDLHTESTTPCHAISDGFHWLPIARGRVSSGVRCPKESLPNTGYCKKHETERLEKGARWFARWVSEPRHFPKWRRVQVDGKSRLHVVGHDGHVFVDRPARPGDPS